MRYEIEFMGHKKRKEAIEAIIKAQNLNNTPLDSADIMALKQFSKKGEAPNFDLDLLLSFTEDTFEELEEANLELANANKKLEVQNKIIQSYSTQQEIKFEELKFAYAQLEHFAQVGSHDLKEPLRNISNFSQLLNDRFEENIDEEGQAYLQIISKGVKQLNNTLDQFIDYLQIDTQFNGAEIVDLNVLVEDITKGLEAKLGNNSFELKVEKLPSIAVNYSLFKRLIKELFVNAIKFNDTAFTKIELSCHELEEDLWLFKIKDNGIGLNEKLADKIFAPFQRTGVHLENENRPIGLAACQKIVKLHKGDIWYDSTGIPGEGTTFLFTIQNIAALPFEKDIPELEDDYTIPK